MVLEEAKLAHTSQNPALVAGVFDPIQFRRRAIDNGFSVIRVVTGDKRPVSKNWQDGEGEDTLLAEDDRFRNTGLVLRNLRAIDVDIDDPGIAVLIRDLVTSSIPGRPLIRIREGSSRFAIVYRASSEQAAKRVVEIERGRVEFLGHAQQLVVDGIHPSGRKLEWVDGRSPATVSFDELPIISEFAVSDLIRKLEDKFPSERHREDTLPFRQYSGEFPQDLLKGIETSNWFDCLSHSDKKAVVEACLSAIDNTQNDPRDRWLKVIFSVSDAEARGCPDAYNLALEWSRSGASWTSEADFDIAWNSAKPGRTTVGTLIHLATQAGADLSMWRSKKILAEQEPALAVVPMPKAVGAVPISKLPELPKKRHWLHGEDLVRGAVSLIVAPGARGKSSWLIALALACASGRMLLGSKVFGGPLRVLYINAEDPLNELALRLRAAMMHHGLRDDDVPGLVIGGADTNSLALIKVDRAGPVIDPAGWLQLNGEIQRYQPDIVILDPLVALTGGASLNDNATAAILMRELVSVAASKNIAIMVAHHSAKGRDVSSAEAAMGAASIVNLARISLAIEPLNEDDAGKLGVPPWEAKSIFRVIGAKQNLSPPNNDSKWFRLTSVTINNPEPPTYENGDAVGVVEKFTPALNATPFPQAMLDAAIKVLASASPPLSPSTKSHDCAFPKVAEALAPYRAGCAKDAEAKAVIDYLIRLGRIVLVDVEVHRKGRSNYPRKGYKVLETPQQN
jgi:hypothetical protein